MRSLPTPTPRAFALLVGGTAVLLAGLVTGTQDAVAPGLFLLALPVVALLAGLVFRPTFSLEREVEPATVSVGEPGRVHLHVTTRRASPVGTVVAEDAPGAALGPAHALRLASAQRGAVVADSYGIQATRRGRVVLDTFRYRFLDLFGFWVHGGRVHHPTDLAVTPAVLPLSAPGVRSYGASGETPIPQTAISGPDDVLVREYQPRDDVRRIHWPSTARAGTLMVRREEAAWDPTAWVLLDSRVGVHPEVDGERPSFELLVSAAASLGLRLLQEGFTLTLVDSEGVPRETSADRPGAREAWLDPLVDVDVSGDDDLHEPTALLAQAGSEHMVIALLGALDRGTADLLVAAAGSRQQRLALVARSAPGFELEFERNRGVLEEHGWVVRAVDEEADLPEAWASAAESGAR